MEKKENIVKLVKATPIELRCSLNGVMDDLCYTLDNLTTIHDDAEETDMLKYSSSVTLSELASSDFLMRSHLRYKKYMKYIKFHRTFHGEMILFLISDFLASCHTPSLMLAAKCVSIDMHIICAMEDLN